MTISSCIRVSTVCPPRVWKTTLFEVEALVAGSKDDEKKLIGPRLIRPLGGIPETRVAYATPRKNLKDTN